MTFDDLPDDRANRIADAVEDIERNVTRLRDFQELSRDAYAAPDEQDRRDAIERKFEKCAEAVVDIAGELCKQERGSVPERRMDVITTIEAEGIVDDELAERLREAVGFRDVLAHTYRTNRERRSRVRRSPEWSRPVRRIYRGGSRAPHSITQIDQRPLSPSSAR